MAGLQNTPDAKSESDVKLGLSVFAPLAKVMVANHLLGKTNRLTIVVNGTRKIPNGKFQWDVLDFLGLDVDVIRFFCCHACS